MNINNRLEDLCQQALQKWGQDKQVIHAVQELTELSLALQQYRYLKVTANEVKDEIGDVIIMVNQLIMMFDISNDELTELINGKLNKLEKGLNK